MKFCLAVGKTTSPTTPLLLEGDFVESMRRARAMGYDAVEIHTPEPDQLDVERLRRACDELGMFIATLGTGMIYGKYGLYLMDPDEERQARIVAMVKRYIDIAQAIGSKVTIGSIKGNVPKGADRAACLEIMGKCMREISAYAVEKGVYVLLEATNHFENNVLNTGRDVHDFIERYALKNVQALIDSFHVNIEERSVPAACATRANTWATYTLATTSAGIRRGRFRFRRLLPGHPRRRLRRRALGRGLPPPGWGNGGAQKH